MYRGLFPASFCCTSQLHGEQDHDQDCIRPSVANLQKMGLQLDGLVLFELLNPMPEVNAAELDLKQVPK